MHKKSNDSNISQELDFISACKPDQKLFSHSVDEKLTIKATPANEQERKLLPIKNSQCQA